MRFASTAFEIRSATLSRDRPLNRSVPGMASLSLTVSELSAGRVGSGFAALTIGRTDRAPCFCKAAACAATVWAICLTNAPSSPISVANGSFAARARYVGDAILASAALSRREISATWRARSAVPRDKSAIWSPRFVRSRRRLPTELKSAMPVNVARRHNGRGAGIDIEAEIKHRAYRDSDKHDTGRDEDGADTSHARFILGRLPGPMQCCQRVTDSLSRIPMFTRPRLRATRSPAMVARNRRLFAGS